MHAMRSSEATASEPLLQRLRPSAWSGQDAPSSSRVAEVLLTGPPGPSWRTVGRVAWWESGNLWRLSWASIIISVFNFSLSLVTQMFAGHMGSLALAGVSIANVGIQGLAFGIMLGMASAVQTVCGQAYGAGRYSTMGVVCQRALLLHLAAAVLLSPLYWFAGPLLRAIGQSTEIAAMGQTYARALMPQLLAYALYLPMQRFLQSQNVVNPMAWLAIGVFGFHVLITWLVVSIFSWGVVGAALTLSFSWWLLVVTTWGYIVLSPKCRETWTGFSTRAFSGMWSYLKLTVASAVMLCLEIWYNQGIVLLSGLLANPEIALDSISICTNYLSWDMMIMLGLSNAASVRVGNELGAGNPLVAKLAVGVVVTTCVVINTALAAVVIALRVQLSKLYTSSAEVVEAVAEMMPLLAISIFLNGIQPILSGVAIGSGWQAIVAYVNVGAYYLVGLPVGCVLGFKAGLGAAGIWWGMIIGVFVQTVILIIITARTNWDKEVDKAAERLKNAGDEEVTLTSVGCQRSMSASI